jgi:O-antigen/teichoic acid export membrane protein
MGVVAGLRFIENIYAGSVVGLQRQVVQNVVTCVLATVRAGGAVAILAWVSPTIEAFFLWQCLISLVTIPTLAALVYGRLPRSPRPGRFSIAALRSVWRFAAGMLAISALSLLLTQADKILLSRLLNLTDFGYYAFAGLVANTLYFLAAPVNAAFYPRFTELATRRDEPALRRVYHQAAQLLSVTVGSVAVVLIVFCNRLLLLWTGDPTLVQHVAPLLVILTAGTLLNALMGIPYQMQLAYGWTSLTIGINLVAVALLVPAVFWAAPRYGAIGAAWVWVMLNVGYLIFMIYFMQRRILKTETWGWYRNGLVFPLLAAMVTALLGNLILPSHMEKVFGFLALVFCSACVLLAACLAAPIARRQFARFITAKIWPSNARH